MRAVWVIVAAAFLAAPAPTVRTVPGTPLRIALPAGWRILDHKTALKAVNQVATVNPQMAPVVSALAKNGSLLRLVAYDPHASGGFTTNANVVAQPAPASSVGQAVSLELPLVERVLHPVQLKRAAAVVAGKPAVTVTFEALFNGGNGATLVAEKQVYFVASGKLYVLTLTTTPGKRASYAATFAQIVKSLAFG